MTVTSDATAPVSGRFDVTVTFSEPVSGFQRLHLEVTNGYPSGLVPGSDGSQYTATIRPVPGTPKTVEIKVPADVATDAAGNSNTASSSFSISYDQGDLGSPPGAPVPTVQCGSGPDDVEVDIVFSEGVSGLSVGDVALTLPPGTGMFPSMGYSPSPVGTTDFSWGATLFGGEVRGNVAVWLPAGVTTDLSGTSNTASNVLYTSPNQVLSVADANATEGTDGTIDFEVRLDARNDCSTVTVDWATADGTAIAGQDYTAASGTLTFGPGVTTKTVSVAVSDDTNVESGETLALRLSNPSGNPSSASIDDAEATGTITDDDGSTLRSNSAPTGLPTITGTVQVGETLTASASGIADDDGLANATFAWQWIANDGNSDTNIAGATGSTYTLTAAEVGKMVKVRATFTDDGGKEETLVSDPTAAVTGVLTARFESVPASHDGSSVFTLELAFTEAVFDGTEAFDKNRAIRDALEVTDGTLRGGRRVDPGAYDRWIVWIRPSGAGTVTVTLPETTGACSETGAICTPDGEALSNAPTATVPGPVSQTREVSIAAAPNATTRSVTPASDTVTEGTAAVFTLTRTGSLTSALTVNVDVSETGTMLKGTPASTVTFDANSATAELSVETEDDEVAESASVVTAALEAGSGYSMDSGASSATVTVEDDDAAPVVTTASPIVTSENGAAITTLTATDDDTPVADLAWSIAGGADQSKVTLSTSGVLAFQAAKDFEAPDDADGDGDYEVTVRVTDGANPIDTALTIRLTDVDEVAPTVKTASVDGAALTLTFDEALDGSAPPASSAFSVTVGGTARGVSNVAMSASTVTLTLASAVVAEETVTVGYTVPTDANASPLEDAAGNTVAAFSDRAVTNATPASNAVPTGLPTISGTARVGETLTASASGIADDDGLANATFAWQWIANDGTADADIAGATAQTYTLTAAEVGKTIKVRATFTDDGGKEETLVSDPTAAVTGVLTARFESVPASHDGSSVFTLELAFTEAVFDGTEAFDKNRAIRDALEVTDGTLRGGRRVDPGAYDRWIVWIRPSGAGTVTVTLPETTGACSETGAICTPDGEALSNAPTATVPGPVSQTREVSIAAAPNATTRSVEYEHAINRYIVPALGPIKLTALARDDVAALHHEMRDKPYQANRTLGVISKMMNQAEAWGLRPDRSNPCYHIRKYRETKRERFLSPDELARLGKALDKEESLAPAAVTAFRLLLYTGARLSEIQTLKWEYVRGNRIHLPDSKTGAKTIPLNGPALEVLAGAKRVEGNPWVVVGTAEGSHLTDLQKPWRRVRKAAGLDDVRIHDLRHTFASEAVMAGESLPMVGKILGHTQTQTTARYAHLADDPLQGASERIATSLKQAMGR